MRRLIYNQRQLPGQLRYGLRPSRETGCGWIAVYNALELMGGHAEPQALIRYFERQAPLLNGNMGTVLWGPAQCFRQWGFETKTLFRREQFDLAARQAQACILFYRWRRGWKVGAHFVALEPVEGGFVGYNTYKNSCGPDAYGPSLEAFLRRRGYFGAVLLTLKRP